MKHHTYFAAAAVLLSLASAPAFAGKAERARTAIAEARAKIAAGDKVGTGANAPMAQNQARAELGNAEALLSRGKKTEAEATARHAGELADMAIVDADRAKMTASRERRIEAETAAAMAQQSAANAQQNVVAADARANNAERAADNANARADMMATLPAAAPAPTTTVAIVEKTVTPTIAKRVAPRKKVVVRRTSPVTTKTTTTTVINRPN